MKKDFKYTLELTEKQMKLLSWTCDNMCRIIEGHDWTYQNFMEMAWEKRCKEATGSIVDKDFEGGWHAMREDAEKMCAKMKKRFWGLNDNTLNGIGYDADADILWDMHCVLRHHLWLDRPADQRSEFTVDASAPFSAVGDEPLCVVNKINEKENK